MGILNTNLAACEPPVAVTSTAHRMLVCATERGGETVHVSLADGMYESDDETIFWRDTPDATVLRLPRELSFVTRPVHGLPRQRRSVESGELALLRAVRASRSNGGRNSEDEQPDSPAATGLRAALIAGDAELALAYAVQLIHEVGTAQTHAVISRSLARVASSWATGTGTVLAEHRATRAAGHVIDRLSAQAPTPAQLGTVLLAVPPGEQHTLALEALCHQLRDAGRTANVVGELPLDELVALAEDPDVLAIVFSLHTPHQPAEVRRVLRRLKAAAPEVFLVVGGPAVRARTTAAYGADLLTQDVSDLLLHVGSRSSGLTAREREVLTDVAAGCTTAETAEHLGIAPSTVKSHLNSILVKSGTEHRAAAVAVGLRRGWIT
jgi:DNA-binding NarL/FixJ family response regulator